MRKYRHLFYRSCESGCFVKVIAVLRFVPPGIPAIRNLRKNEKKHLDIWENADYTVYDS